MNKHKAPASWWGAPRKFTTSPEERKISWLELFYDLIYVIAISTITHHIAVHFSLDSLLDYIYLFTMIYWGWLNGSLYHDLHGTSGLRTKLMTFWQMIIVAALVITLNGPEEDYLFNATIVIMIMQLYITYLWWSVGIYDKRHRRLNIPYTLIYLLSFALIFTTLFLEMPYLRIVFYLTLILNYLPPFISHQLLKHNSMQLNLSSSMTERLGLFTIIIFGEVVFGVISGTSALKELSFSVWLNFGLAICIVFALWWLFFTLISDRECKAGLINSSILEILYIPALLSLALIGAACNGLFEYFSSAALESLWIKNVYGFSLSLFLFGIYSMLFMLTYSGDTLHFKRLMQQVLLVFAIVFILLTLLLPTMPLGWFLGIFLSLLVVLIYFINQQWYHMHRNEPS